MGIHAEEIIKVFGYHGETVEDATAKLLDDDDLHLRPPNQPVPVTMAHVRENGKMNENELDRLWKLTRQMSSPSKFPVPSTIIARNVDYSRE
jgi:hypothetical protein